MAALPALFSADTPQAQLALELATGLYPAADIFKAHGISGTDAKLMLADPQFRAMVGDYRKLWNSPLNATERVRIKSAVMVEDGLLELHAIFHDVTLAPQARLDAFKQAVVLSDMAPRQNAVQAGERFTLTINLPAAPAEPAKTITIDAEALQTPALEDSTDA
jgi:hypothetical protein